MSNLTFCSNISLKLIFPKYHLKEKMQDSLDWKRIMRTIITGIFRFHQDLTLNSLLKKNIYTHKP